MSNLLLSYYGDDFTGSTDVMEAMQWAGLRTVLFLAAPTREQLARFENLRAFGVAGWSRTMSPAEMEAELKPALERLRESGAPLVHYKGCSTFDSSPEIGSIGKALEIGREIFGERCVPILAGAPALGRFTVFGNLFARSGLDTDPFRLDRHPTRRQHPITPMDEADLRLHLARQTRLRIGLVDVLRLEEEAKRNCTTEERGRGEFEIRPCPPRPLSSAVSSTSPEPAALLFDIVRDAHLPIIGRMISEMGAGRQLFAIGSSGIEYALTAHLVANGQIDTLRSHPAGHPSFGPADQLVVITGSCSPVNDRQIGWALQNGFVEVPLHPARLIRPDTSEAEIDSSIRRGLELVSQGANVILHSSRGPDDPRVGETLCEYAALGFSELDIKLKNGRTLGPKLGRILQGILERKKFTRAGVAGGDTSGYVARELGIEALEAIAPVAPGSPLCRAHADNSLHGLEVIFKGGQVGKIDVWGTMLHGTANTA